MDANFGTIMAPGGEGGNKVDITALAETLRSNWLIVALVLFAGVVFWGFWPRRKRRLEESSRNPPND
ncbi:MAG: cbb3-type cytochrome c oxidase subunit 3 [Rhodospirillales bacterium]|jgi:cbb3-type cytochrome oxidase subunit 3|nr:cbb3-type cytochrome c oxidase subunit 3 [Rhodospirillales bacterium]MDP6773541.1 cbb3-type cytochrome c oxidase subunit 3 [Rhodospirillales bacterium]|tara:strand:+ start:151 stop:351 length:201 start_codon:yes stop_codon:yes gene_type:complete